MLCNTNPAKPALLIIQELINEYKHAYECMMYVYSMYICVSVYVCMCPCIYNVRLFVCKCLCVYPCRQVGRAVYF
jgi:hypothetical protein